MKAYLLMNQLVGIYKLFAYICFCFLHHFGSFGWYFVGAVVVVFAVILSTYFEMNSQIGMIFESLLNSSYRFMKIRILVLEMMLSLACRICFFLFSLHRSALIPLYVLEELLLFSLQSNWTSEKYIQIVLVRV